MPADQLRIAADLLEQGYQPAFIARYRADESGNLPSNVLWALKFARERQHQLDTARQESLAHLGEGVELDDEGRERLERANTTVDIDVALRCFRARRAARQSGERSGQASELLEKMIAATAPVADLPTWTAEQLSIAPDQSEAIVQQCSRLVASLLAGDTRLMERMRQAIQKKASVRIEAQAESPAKPAKTDKAAEKGSDKASGVDAATAAGADALEGAIAGQAEPSSEAAGAAEGAADAHDSDSASDAWAHDDDDMVGDHAEDSGHADSHEHGEPGEHGESSELGESSEAVRASDAAGASESAEASPSAEASGETTEASAAGDSATPPISLTFASNKKSRENKLSAGKRKERAPAAGSAKALAKLTPRQRRRRWLTSVLQPFRSLKKPLHRLTAYQMLMIGRGQRSQLIKVELDYDRRALVNMARDVFVNDSHPLSKWFAEACDHALSGGLLAKVEADALAEEDEWAQQKLLEAATDQLRVSLLQRPVKGHRILVVDTVGPNSSCVAIIDARGKCLATQEVVCSSQPSVVSQNVIMLGELVHKHKVTLVALSNGPARRFLIHTVAELMKQSASGKLRWTMVDRGGAEAYATSRQASVELPQLNRRFRAAVWLGRRLQDPLGELLKLDTSRLRLGSYQRELPQEPLKRLVTATLSDCLCVKGVDARYASEQQFSYVPGVTPEIAARLSEMATKREFVSRESLVAALGEWSETGKRQALGFLRIYQSPQTLDGTLIHPDDYRLAQRLIENSELTQPPAAPEGWLPPKIKVPKPPKNAPQTSAAASAEAEPTLAASAEAGGPVEGTEQPSAELAGSEAPSSEVSASEPSAESGASEAAAESTTKALEAAPPAESDTAPAAIAEATAAPSAEAESSPGSAGTEAAGAETAEAEAVGADGAGTEAVGTEEDAASGASTAALAPEYSEDVVAQAAAAPTIDVEKMARGWQVGRAKLAWLAECLSNPFGDSRDQRPPVPMLGSVPTLSDLTPGMSVYAIVVGVAEFGAFVELGPDCGGLIHISRLSPRYIEDPHQAVQIGDLVQAWVVSVDVDKKRVALTALSPEQQQQQQAEAQRHAQQQPQRGYGENRGNRGGQPGGGGRTGGRAGAGQQGGGQMAGSGQGRGGRAGGQGGGGGGGRSGGGPRRERGGGGPGGGRGGRRDAGETTSRPVVIKSKKPSAPITEAMKKGQEPLRSFSDLMQYFEVQRTDTSPAAAPVVVEPKNPPATTQPEATNEPPAGPATDE